MVRCHVILLSAMCYACASNDETSIQCKTQVFDTGIHESKSWDRREILESMVCEARCGYNTACFDNMTWLQSTCPHQKATNGEIKHYNITGRPCKSDGVCRRRNKMAVCFLGRCACNPGRVVDRLGFCVRRCSVYGNGFTNYRGLSIKGENTESFHFKNMTVCKEKCLQTNAFLCLSVEVGYKKFFGRRQHDCHTCDKGYLDVELEKRSTDDEYVLSMRNCFGATHLR